MNLERGPPIESKLRLDRTKMTRDATQWNNDRHSWGHYEHLTAKYADKSKRRALFERALCHQSD